MVSYWHGVRENLLLALDTLRTHKFRSFLTILGVLIGTATVIAVASIFAGLDHKFAQMAEDFGTRTLFIFKFDPGVHIGRMSKEERMRKPLTYTDAMALKEQCPSIEKVAVEPDRWANPPVVKYKGLQMIDSNFIGATPSDFEVVNDHLADGRFFTEIDDTHRRDVAVIAPGVAKRFFANEDPVGKTILVDGNGFEVIGTLQARKEFGDNGSDRVIKVPYNTFMKLYPDTKENVILAMAYPGKLDQAIDEATGVLRRRRHVKPSEKNNFGISTADSFIQEFRQIMGMVVLVTVVISSIGLLVGGIGVMNIMLVSVTERTREIGVRKAIGARRSDIIWQFLLEAMTLTGAGGVLGILLGGLISLLIRVAADIPSFVPVWSVIVGFAVAVSIGLFFGIWPATKAARLDPIVALHHE